MTRTLILGLAVAGLSACASGTRVTSGGDVASVTPANRNYLPVGTTMTVRLDQAISTASREGDTFSATVADPVYASDNTIAVPAGATLFGHVTGVHAATLPTEQNVIRLNFDELRMNGRAYPFSGSISNVAVQNKNGGSNTTRAAVTGAAAGAVLGAVLSGGELSKIITGGLLGAAAGTVISMGTGTSAQATIPAGSTVVVRSTQPVQVR